MGIKVHQCDGAHVMVNGTEQGERNGMIASKTHEVGHLPQEGSRRRLDLGNGLGNVERVAGHIPGIDHLLVAEGLGVVGGMVLRPQMPRRLADRLRPKAGPGAVARPGIERDPENCHVTVRHVTEFRESGKGRRAGKTRHNRAAHRLDGWVCGTWHIWQQFPEGSETPS
jgi:hypothetical protein